MIGYITLDDAQIFIERCGFLVRDYGLLDAALHRPRSVVFGQESYPTVHTKAAALLDSLSRAHVLIDGNKRLSLALTSAFYRINGFVLSGADEEIEVFIMKVAGDHLPVGDVAMWLKEHVTPEV